MAAKSLKNNYSLIIFVLISIIFFLLLNSSSAFQSDELLGDDEEFGLEGSPKLPDVQVISPSRPSQTVRKKSSQSVPGSDSDSKVQFSLEHAFGESDFSPAGTFTARLKTSPHGGQTLTKLRFSRNDFTEAEKESFKKLLEADDFYKIRVASNLLSPPGRDYVVSSVKARCLSRDRLDEHFVIHMILPCSLVYSCIDVSESGDGVNVLAINYGSPGACQYPRLLKFPKKWSFVSHTVLKSTEQAPRTPVFSEDIPGGEDGEGEGVKPPERSFWAKYWMYLLPIGLIVMNAITQAMNLPEEQQAGGQTGAQVQQAVSGVPRGQGAAVRRR